MTATNQNGHARVRPRLGVCLNDTLLLGAAQFSIEEFGAYTLHPTVNLGPIPSTPLSITLIVSLTDTETTEQFSHTICYYPSSA